MRSSPRIRPAAAVLAAVLGLSACATTEPETGSGTTNGQEGTQETAFEFETRTLEGEAFEGEELRGEPVVLWFWAPWCVVCRSEAPGVVEAADRFDGQVEFVGVAGRGEVGEMRQFTADTSTDGLRHIVDADGTVWSGFGVASQPAFAFLRPDGTFTTVTGTLAEDDLDEHVRTEVLAGRDGG
ncbi:redoxin domain-containing protein [Nocardiopsis sp. EMB25]|uniref:redoxin domain-containing protein n=1 Tax=Nocardiopsis sp. EMB25 TaxID=2835867 RepID=UPI0022846F4A|nr:redoxin domain-containing protein [Nocardiopsis sp. EMB25]MCY9785249.1 redoxin domain-containing protein [Nocardiopsis sp. EMB25]